METIGNAAFNNYYAHNKYMTNCRDRKIQGLELSCAWKQNNFYAHNKSAAQQNSASIIFLKVNMCTHNTHNNYNYSIFLFYIFFNHGGE